LASRFLILITILIKICYIISFENRKYDYQKVFDNHLTFILSKVGFNYF